MKTEEIIETLNKTKAANTLYKMAKNLDKYSEKEIENTVNDLIDESLNIEEI